MMRKAALIVAIALLALCGVFAWIQFSYIRVEALTAKHGLEFSFLMEEFDRSRSSSDIVYYKVFDYSPERAKLFVVDRDPENRYGGFYVFTSKITNDWEVDWVKGVWASHGSADDWTWPPYGIDPAGIWKR